MLLERKHVSEFEQVLKEIDFRMTNNIFFLIIFLKYFQDLQMYPLAHLLVLEAWQQQPRPLATAQQTNNNLQWRHLVLPPNKQ